MADIVPELLATITKDFEKHIENNREIDKLLKLIQSGNATYKQADEYAVWIGKMLSLVIEKNITSDILPDGKMYYNIAERILGDRLKANYDLITSVTNQVQTSINKRASIGVKAVTPELNQSRIDGLVDRLSAEEYDKIKWITDEPIVNFGQAIVKDSVKKNSEFLSGLGLSVKVQRIVSGDCCEWCQEVAGIYDSRDASDDIYRGHERCRCYVEQLVSKDKTYTRKFKK